MMIRIIPLLAATAMLALSAPPAAAPRPNILWITSEDNGPNLGCYGDPDAITPNLDALARRSVRYLHCWSGAPVCAPARTTIISGMYPASTGSEHMRSMVRLPEGFGMFPQSLRGAGYYCTNNSKEDYNLQKPGKVWDESSPKAHWKSRAPGQPFFAVINHTITHESQIRNDIAAEHRVHDPARVSVPPYHPDAPEVRKDWAQYHDRITMMDRLVGQNLKELDDAGLAQDTIVFYYGDHGSGMPRHKRCPQNSGLRVPLLVHVPARFQHLAPAAHRAGAATERLVGFVDLAPTVLSLAGVKIPGHFQGVAFLGAAAGPEREYLHGYRARMDERLDLVRSVRDRRYVYVRHYMPHLPYGQHVSYMFQTPTTRVWKERFDAGTLPEAQAAFWKSKAPEELYDLQEDPHELVNLATSPKHEQVVQRFRMAQQAHALAIRDVSLLPEALMHTRAASTTPYQYGHSRAYAIEAILNAAGKASQSHPNATPELVRMLSNGEAGVRYWAALGLHMRGKAGVLAGETPLRAAFKDEYPDVRIAAAQALAIHGNEADRRHALELLVELADPRRHAYYVNVHAWNALDALDAVAKPAAKALAALPLQHPEAHNREGDYLQRLSLKTLADLRLQP